MPLITARWVLPVATPPLRDAGVLVEGRIREVGTRKWFAKRDVGNVLDLGETILIPGLVNAHCHMEFSTSPNPRPHPSASGRHPLLSKERDGERSDPGGDEGGIFTEWVRQITSEDRHGGLPLQDPIQLLLRGGTTTVADHCGPDVGAIHELPLRRIVFWEVLGVDPERARNSLTNANQRTQEAGGFITPHSLYAVHEEVLEEIFGSAGTALKSIHILESSDEDQFFRNQSGPLADLVRERGGTVPFPDRSPVRWLGGHEGLGPGTLLIHGNYLSEEEIRLLRGSGAFVIHCPGSRRFFGHRPFPLEALVEHNVGVALGTDSLASNDSLNLLKEMKRMKEDFPGWGEEEILRFATINGATALGMEEEIGTIEVGKKADLVGIPLRDEKVDPYEALLLADEVSFSMVGGRVIYHV